jgi:signal transduction histidine kinase/ActR/RegA family two-component response regulator
LQRLFGVRAKVGDDLLSLLRAHPDAQSLAREYWSRALAGEEFTATDEFGDPRSERRHYEMKFNSLRDANGRFLGAFQFVYDVTDRLREQARLAEAEQHLRQTQKFDAIGQLSGGIAHDFNNLLMVISGGLSLLVRSKDSQQQQRIIERMRQAAERGSSLSRQLLTFARRQSLHAEPVDLRQQIGGMREILDRTLRGDVIVEADLSPELWPVMVDPTEFELVILNLCVNSRDAMPKGGVITIAAQNVAGMNDIGLSGDFVCLTVADTGVGMPPEVLARVFEPFFTTKETGKGTGLGLAQVYGFSQQSGGAVQMTSNPGRGTTASLYLPRSAAAPATHDSLDASSDSNPSPRPDIGSILVVEDSDEVAALVSEMLSELGYRATRVASAQAALGALADNREIDLVFSDVMMPGSMNGLDLARELRKRRPDLPVVLTTGYAGPALRSAYEEGIDVLPKPYELAALDAALSVARSRKPVER